MQPDVLHAFLRSLLQLESGTLYRRGLPQVRLRRRTGLLHRFPKSVKPSPIDSLSVSSPFTKPASSGEPINGKDIGGGEPINGKDIGGNKFLALRLQPRLFT